MTEKVNTPSAVYHALAEQWALPLALMNGTRAMREAGVIYLPQEPAESDNAYCIRKARSTLFNGFRKTVRDMAGKVFAKPIALGEDVPPQLVTYAENIDLAGRALNVFALDVFTDALQVGIAHILVDMPPSLPEGATRADEYATGNRPYLCHVRAEDLIGWKSETIGGVETLTQIRIRECVEIEDPANRFEKTKIDQVRVLEPGFYEIWRKVKDSWAMVVSGKTSVDAITLATVYTNRAGFMQGLPPLQDLADLNVAHWQSASDQRNILHVARVPILFGSGIPEDAPNIQIGASTMSRTADPAAKLSYVEHSGAAIGAGRDDLKDLEGHMQALGLELILPKSGDATATGEAIDQAAMNAPLAIMAAALQDALELAFGYMAEYDGLGKDAGGSITVNTDFGVSMRDTADLTTLLAARNAGMITGATFLKEMKRRGVLADDIDLDDEAEAAKDDVPLGLMVASEPDNEAEAEAA